MKKPILITTSDWHLRSTVPVSRLERCWYDVMEQRITQLMTAYPHVPIVIAGDVFDRPDPPSSLVSWAISFLRGYSIYTLPGQHDLPNHRYNARDHGAYGALVKANVLRDLPAYEWTSIGSMRAAVAMYSMPWDHYEVPVNEAPSGLFRLGVMHKYAWATAANCYVGADPESNAVGLTKYMKHFDLLAIGDNHISWKMPMIVNHGSLFSFTSAQVGHIPLVGVVYDDHTFEIQPFPEIDPQWQPNAIDEKVSTVLASLNTIETVTAGFKETIAVYAEQSEGIERDVYNALLDHLTQ